MSITQTMTKSFLGDLAAGTHVLASDNLYMALYLSTASLDADTTAYTATGETSGTGYVAGGQLLTGVTVSTADEGLYISFNNPVWATSSFTARGALIYNATRSNKSIAVLNFGSDKVAGPSFTVTLPSNTSTTALLRIVY